MNETKSGLLINLINQWFITKGFNFLQMNDLQNELIKILNDNGFKVIRSHIFLNTLHPQIGYEVFRWFKKDHNIEIGIKSQVRAKVYYNYDEATIEKVSFSHGAKEYELFKKSPIYYVSETRQVFRHKFSENETDFKYPILKDFNELGVTDYLVIPLNYNFYDKYGVTTWVSTKEGGFTEEDIFILHEVSKILSVYIVNYLEKQLTKILLSTYLGKITGEKVLSGVIQRGDIQRIESAIWFSDIRGFSKMANENNTNTLIEWLNDYFDLICDSIIQNNGEILKFIGDAVLAIFPVIGKTTPEKACKNSLKASIQANKKLDKLNAERKKQNKPELNHGIGLHFGMVEYGNIGSSERLDFTVIGSSVNLASRIESLCSKLSEKNLFSEKFVSVCGNDNFKLIGEHNLKGFEKVEKIYILK